MEKVNTDKYGNVYLTVPQAMEVLLRGHSLDRCFVEDSTEASLYNKNTVRYMECDEQLRSCIEQEISFEEYHHNLSQDWLMPDKYKSLDIRQYVLDRVTTKEERDRVETEMSMYEQRQLIPLLQFAVYLVDVMKTNNIVWGVGRGSSVSSYVLFLIGLHRIDSIKYCLAIEEFLK